MVVALLSIPSAFALDLEPPVGLKRGSTATLVATGGTPGDTAGLVLGGPAPGPCPAVLGGLCLSVSNPTLVDTAVVRADGTATFRVRVPANAPLVDARFQAATTGGAPAVSPARVVPVLTALGAPFTVRDAASFAIAERAWRADDDLTFAAGNYPDVAVLPYLEEAGDLVIDGHDRDLTFPRLTSLAGVEIWGPGGGISAPAAVGSRGGALAPAEILIFDTTSAATVDLPSFVEELSIVVTYARGPVGISAPSAALEHVSLTANSGDLSGVVPTATALGGTLEVTDHQSAVLDALPLLAEVDRVRIWDSPYGNYPTSPLTTVRLGAPGVVITGDLFVQHQQLLTDVSGLSPAFGVPLVACTDNPALPSCACDAWMALDPTPDAALCEGNAPDTCSDAPTDVCW